MATKLIPLSKIKPKKIVRKEERTVSDRARGLRVLKEAENYWMVMDRFRWERQRNKRYLFGDQWGDRMPDGQTEAAYIRKEGNTPLKNNLIRRLVRNVLGYYRNQNNEPTCTARDRKEQPYGEVISTLLQANMQRNCMEELRARELEEFLISGLVVERKGYGWMNDSLDCWTTVVPVNNFIVDNNMIDPRGWDCSFVGEVHDLSYEDVCSQFSKSPSDFNSIRNMYAFAANRQVFSQHWADFGYFDVQDIDFFVGKDYNRCRVFEVWRKEQVQRYRCHDWLSGEIFKIDIKDKPVLVDAENASRMAQGRAVGMPDEEIPLIDCEWFVDSVWYYYFLSPFGDILEEGESPYDHKSHPYVFKAYPFVDGEIHSFVNDVIDQQRFINRLIIMMDMAMRSSAKGLMMIPEECIPDGMSRESFAEMSTSFRGMLFYKSRNLQHIPSVITSNSMNVGMSDLLNIQMKFMEDIAGVHGALQGKTPSSGTSGTLYAQQAENSTTSLVDVVMSFNNFEIEAAKKNAKNILQFYDDRRIMEIAGDNLPIDATPDRIRDLDFDISVNEAQRTAAYREMANELLVQMLQGGQISLEQMLENGDFPFADKLLQSIQAEKERAEEQAAMQPQLPAQPQQPQANAQPTQPQQ